MPQKEIRGKEYARPERLLTWKRKPPHYFAANWQHELEFSEEREKRREGRRWPRR